MPLEGTKIQDYAIIANGRSAALISNRGSLDWLCWPRFDSASIFGAILDPQMGGTWRIHPVQESNVLETTFSSSSGKIVLTEFMPVAFEEQKKRTLWPEHELVRQVKCTEGKVDVIVEFEPRPDYGRVTPAIANRGKLGWRVRMGSLVVMLRTDVELSAQTNHGLRANFTLQADDVVAFALTFSAEAPGVITPLGELINEKLDLTMNYWRQWSAQSTYQGRIETSKRRGGRRELRLDFHDAGRPDAEALYSSQRAGGAR